MNFLKTLSFVAFDNDFDTDSRAWVPEVWAAETLAILEENMVIGGLVYIEFSNEIANFGDTVNTRMPAEFTAQRKGVNDDVTVQAATAVNVPVVLNQHVHTSFRIRDGEESLSFKDLIAQYLRPAAKSLAEHIDRILLGQVYQYLDNQVAIDPDTSDDIKDVILDVREKMNINKVPMEGRNLILSPVTETEALKLDLFISAERVGDDGTAMRKASLGEKFGLQTFMCQNVPGITTENVDTPSDGAAGDTNQADCVAGDTTITTVTGTVHDDIGQPGKYVSLEDDGGVYRLAACADTLITLDRPLLSDVADNTDINYYKTGIVDLSEDTNATTYPIGFSKQINFDGATIVPQIGQLVAFSAAGAPDVIATPEYCIIDVATGIGTDNYYVLLDRPLEEELVDGDIIDYGPIGQYNFAFDKGALALVVRPLALPKAGSGALSGVSSFNDLSMRVVITYDGVRQGHLVTLDLLCGVKVLDEDRGAVLVR